MPGDRPIIFSAPMVRALLEGRKTQTRRLADKPASVRTSTTVDGVPTGLVVPDHLGGERVSLPSTWRSVKSGDRLWVREAWKPHSTFDHLPPREIPQSNMFYLADERYSPSGSRSRPSIHMPRWASRITLTVTDVRVQRLQEISAGDAIREGIAYPPAGMTMDEACEYGTDPRSEFRSLWNSLHGPGAWDADPWVVALTFTVARQNIDVGGADDG